MIEREVATVWFFEYRLMFTKIDHELFHVLPNHLISLRYQLFERMFINCLLSLFYGILEKVFNRQKGPVFVGTMDDPKRDKFLEELELLEVDGFQAANHDEAVQDAQEMAIIIVVREWKSLPIFNCF